MSYHGELIRFKMEIRLFYTEVNVYNDIENHEQRN